MNKDMSNNWIKRELKESLAVNFPQHTAMAHRGSEFTNKFFFNHPQLNLMTSQKIKDFILEKEIRRVMVFTDGWEDDSYNDEYGKMYINPNGKIISELPDKKVEELPIGHTEIKLPIAYFLRDLISECAELDFREVFVFQNTKHLASTMSVVGKNTEIDHQLVSNKLVSLMERYKDDQNLFNKLIVSSLMNSFINVRNVHSVYMPLVLSYTNPGNNVAESIVYKLISGSLSVKEEKAIVPNINQEFSMITSERV